MILVDGEKPLTDSFQRIAIFAEEIQDEDEKRKILDKEKNPGSNLLAAKRVEKPDSSCCGGAESSNTTSTNSCCASKQPNKPKELEEPKEPKELKETSGAASRKTSCSCCVTGIASSSCKKHSSPVYVLRASKRQVYNVEKDSLRLLDPVVEIPNSKVGLDIIQKVSKSKKMYSCRDKRIKEEVIHSVVYPTKHTPNSSCCSNKNVTELKQLNLGKYRNSPDANNTPFVYQFQLSMNKPNKLSNDKKLNKNLLERGMMDPNHSSFERKIHVNDLEQLPRESSEFGYPSNIIRPTLNEFASASAPPQVSTSNNGNIEIPSSTLPDISNGLLYDLYIADSCTVPGSCSCEAESCACPDCTEHGKYRNSNLTVKQQFEEYPFPLNDVPGPVDNLLRKEIHGIRPYGKVEMHQSSIPLFEQTFLKVLGSQVKEESQQNQMGIPEEDSSQGTEMDYCYCEPDRCCCYNCIQHGIINGIRISDGVCIAEGEGSTPQEIQLLASQFPLYANSPESSTRSTPTVMSESESEDYLKSTLSSNLMEARMNASGNNINSNHLANESLPDKEHWMRYHNTMYTNHIGLTHNFTQQDNQYKTFSSTNVSLDGNANGHPESVNSQDELISTLLNR
ncbi:hypothetical protein PMKS-000533 [Pichia membranifaciens]|uniref:Copper-fist domain-containing protein n=1 Tax=Pichia membranifaciens TaxID=4926 RepID=A0A1Q2YC10_9ASCO|nr:hypothetical protein PMKS-000533 [Pichia membranifaciens]